MKDKPHRESKEKEKNASGRAPHPIVKGRLGRKIGGESQNKIREGLLRKREGISGPVEPPCF